MATGSLETKRALRRQRQRIGERIEDLLEELGWSQSEFSRRLKAAGFDVSQTLVSRKVAGGGITGDQLIAFSAVLGVSYTWLMGLTDDRKKWEPDRPLDSEVAAPRVYSHGHLQPSWFHWPLPRSISPRRVLTAHPG